MTRHLTLNEPRQFIFEDKTISLGKWPLNPKVLASVHLAGMSLILLFLTACGGPEPTPTPTLAPMPTAPVQPTPQAPTLAPQLNSEGAVAIEVAPVGPIVPGQPLAFEVSMNTHSVDLNYDMAVVCVLRDDTGKEYPPTSWEGSPPGGHHRYGTLHFAPLATQPKFIELVIREVAGVKERVYHWDL